MKLIQINFYRVCVFLLLIFGFVFVTHNKYQQQRNIIWDLNVNYIVLEVEEKRFYKYLSEANVKTYH